MNEELIKRIQDLRGSKVVVYFTGDRQPIGARIAEDAVRQLYEHLLLLGDQDKIDLFLYSRGGDVSVPWRIVSMFREFCKEFSVLIPYKAHSSATLISLGADKIVMGKKAELGPIDPTLVRTAMAEGTAGVEKEIAVEDVNSYISFIRDRANISDQSALAGTVSILANSLTPLVLGKVNRQYSHIRLVARKLLSSRKEKLDEAKMTSIIETLTEKMYSHGHAIGRKEAVDIGLPVEEASGDLQNALWELYSSYEEYLSLRTPVDPESALVNSDRVHQSALPVAVIESETRMHAFKLEMDIIRRRQVPPNPQINVQLNVNLPASCPVDQLPAALQASLQQMINQGSQQISGLVRQELMRQSPEAGIDIKCYGGKWQEN